ncbi:MAG: hypothetical protein EOM66_03095 [Clostridia bacterium]|nr:hypothetical protein [Clostridia bacterium]
MSIHLHTDYYQDFLEKWLCFSCDRQFILGEELAKGRNIRCPYCGGHEVISDALVVDEEILFAMGCGGIYFEKEAPNERC